MVRAGDSHNMITMTHSRSRPAESPVARINSEAVALAAQAELILLRQLLLRCDNYLASVVQEARIDDEPDTCAEELRRDISLALSD